MAIEGLCIDLPMEIATQSQGECIYKNYILMSVNMISAWSNFGK